MACARRLWISYSMALLVVLHLDTFPLDPQSHRLFPRFELLLVSLASLFGVSWSQALSAWTSPKLVVTGIQRGQKTWIYLCVCVCTYMRVCACACACMCMCVCIKCRATQVSPSDTVDAAALCLGTKYAETWHLRADLGPFL